MSNFDANCIAVVQADAKRLIAALDDALAANAQMLLSAVETARTGDLPISSTQDVYGHLIDGAGQIYQSRESFRKSLTKMTAIVANSPHKERMEGCPLGMPRIRQPVLQPA